MRPLILSLILALLPLVYACVATPKPGMNQGMRNDPLIGKVIRASTAAPISFDDLVRDLDTHDIIYLSEKHDNPEHHAIQQRIIKELAGSGRMPVIGFEFFSVHDTPLLLSLMDAKKAKHTPETERAVQDRMRQKLGWENQTDQMWSFYWDLLMTARDKALWAAGLDLATALKRRITRKGTDGLTPIEKNTLFSTGWDNPVYADHMKAVFKTVHCGMSPGKMADRLFDTWQARNDRIALSIVELHRAVQAKKSETGTPPGRRPGPVVVIIGNGHTEYGLGVMNRVAHLNPALSQVNLAMTEVHRAASDLDAYLAPLDLEGFDPVPPAEYIWFTQRVSYEDPCIKFREAMKKRKGQKKKTEQN